MIRRKFEITMSLQFMQISCLEHDPLRKFVDFRSRSNVEFEAFLEEFMNDRTEQHGKGVVAAFEDVT